MAQNITILGASYSAVPAVTLPKTGGGTARFDDASVTTATASDVASGKVFLAADGTVTTGTSSGGGGSATQDQDGFIVLPENGGSSIDVEPLSVTSNGTYTAPDGAAYSPVTVNVSGGGGGSWNWMGENPTKVKEWTERVYLKDTPIPDWTWSTASSPGIIAASDLSPSQTLDLSSYDYIQLVKFKVAYDYGDWPPMSASMVFSFVGALVVYGRFSNYASVSSGAPNVNFSLSYSNAYGLIYKNGSGANAYTSTAYGVNVSATTSPTISSSTTDTPSVTFKSPAINMRGGTSYLSQTAFDNLDFDASYYDMVNEIWRVDKGTSPSGYFVDEARNLVLGGE